MKILILGGTRFLGRHLATEVLSREHALTLFDPDLEGLPDDRVEAHLREVSELREERWDACLDTSTRAPERAAELAEALDDRVGRYVYISSVDVHLLESAGGEPEADELRGHGARKQAVERALSGRLGPRLTVLRPGLLVGPHDASGRFAYWVERALTGAEFLAPAPREAPVQLADVRDVARFAVDVCEREAPGTLDVVGPASELTFGGLLDRLVAMADPLSTVTWVDNGFLLDHGLEPWRDIPLWLTEEGPRSVANIDGTAAAAVGFEPRPLDETLRDTLDWFAELGRETSVGAGYLARARERELLSEWHRDAARARHPLAAGHEI